MNPAVKICGLTSEDAIDAALSAGADMVGFVFFPPSPRHLILPRAKALGARVRAGAEKVALTVDADDATLAALVEALAPDALQLHGGESPERVAAVRRRFGLPVMKAIGVGVAADLAAVAAYVGVADRVLLDAKPPKHATRPGGNARAFDWTLLEAAQFDAPWMLSGGLDIDNVADAVRITGAPALDVSSGVEIAPGVKDPARIAAFISRARAALGSPARSA